MMRLSNSDLEASLLRSQNSAPGRPSAPEPNKAYTGISASDRGEIATDRIPDYAPDQSMLAADQPSGSREYAPSSGSNGSMAGTAHSELDQGNGAHPEAAIEAASGSTSANSLDTSSDPGADSGSDSGSETERGFLPVLRNRNFLTLWSGQVFSQLADKIYLVLMISLIENRFQAAGQTISGWVSSIMIASTIPAVLFGSIAGVYVDRWSKKGVLVSTNLLRGLAVFALPFLLWLTKGWLGLGGLPVGFWILIATTFVVSTLTQFFAPAEQSAMPLVVERRHSCCRPNSLYTTTAMASVIIGFAVGEPLASDR